MCTLRLLIHSLKCYSDICFPSSVLKSCQNIKTSHLWMHKQSINLYIYIFTEFFRVLWILAVITVVISAGLSTMHWPCIASLLIINGSIGFSSFIPSANKLFMIHMNFMLEILMWSQYIFPQCKISSHCRAVTVFTHTLNSSKSAYDLHAAQLNIWCWLPNDMILIIYDHANYAAL